MRILMLHNFYQHRGGEGVSFAAESEALRSLGHEVDTFTLDNVIDLSAGNKIQLAVNTIWCRNSYQAVQKKMRGKKYDLLHVQNFFPLFSPSVYDAARSCGVPVVQALRNYRLFCMQTGLFRDGKICTDCSGKQHAWAGIKHRCYRGSLGGSLTVAAMIEFHRLRKTWQRRVDAFIAVSGCVKEQYVSNGWNPDQICVKHNTVSPVPDIELGEDDGFVVVGRVSEDKGLWVLLDAWNMIRKSKPANVPVLTIIGDGPLENEVKERVHKLNLQGHVTLAGRLSLQETYLRMGRASASIQPSVRYEPCSRTIAESYAVGTPVIAAKIGGAVELVEDGVSGFHFPAGNARALADAVMKFMGNPALAKSMRNTVRQKFDREFAPLKNAERLVEIYSSVIARHKGGV